MSQKIYPAYRYKRPPKKRKAVALEVPVIVTKRTAKPEVAPPPAAADRKSIVITRKRSKLRGEPASPDAAAAGYEEATAHYRAVIASRLRK